MGIIGLRSALRLDRISIKKLKLTSVAVDASAWIYECVKTNPKSVMIDNQYDVVIRHCWELIQVLIGCDIDTTMVFDGISPPIREEKKLERARTKKENYELYQSTGSEMYLIDAFKISHDLVFEVVKVLKECYYVSCIVCAYEADAQLAYLAKKHEVDAVISNDTDLIVFGVEKVLFQFDKHGMCNYYNKAELYRSHTRNLNLEMFDDRKFREMCVLSGCDYVEAHGEIGVVCNRMRRHGSWREVLAVYGCKEGHEMKVENALLAYKYYLVYDKSEKRMVRFNDVEEQDEALNLDFLGSLLDEKTATGIAEGRINPSTMKIFPKLNIDEEAFEDNTLEEGEIEEELEEVEEPEEGEIEEELEEVEEPVEAANGNSLPRREKRKIKFPLIFRFRLLFRAIYKKVCKVVL